MQSCQQSDFLSLSQVKGVALIMTIFGNAAFSAPVSFLVNCTFTFYYLIIFTLVLQHCFTIRDDK